MQRSTQVMVILFYDNITRFHSLKKVIYLPINNKSEYRYHNTISYIHTEIFLKRKKKTVAISI